MPGRLWAISDIHITYKSNRDEWAKLLPKGPDDGLILAGDIGETVAHLDDAFELAKAHFKHIFWVPGNHELYTSNQGKDDDESKLRGEAKYQACIDAAQRHGVITPEDDYIHWQYLSVDTGNIETAIICPLFTLYDYSFRPADVPLEDALDWAMEEGIRATDESLLHPDPHKTREDWCQVLLKRCESKLAAARLTNLPLVLINHWPLREDLVFIPRVPRFIIWCGTKRTHDWHVVFGAKVVVTGHLHVRRTDWIDGVRFEEVSLGYPKQWQSAREAGNDVNSMLREILPGPKTPAPDQMPPTNWRLYDT